MEAAAQLFGEQLVDLQRRGVAAAIEFAPVEKLRLVLRSHSFVESSGAADANDHRPRNTNVDVFNSRKQSSVQYPHLCSGCLLSRWLLVVTPLCQSSEPLQSSLTAVPRN